MKCKWVETLINKYIYKGVKILITMNKVNTNKHRKIRTKAIKKVAVYGKSSKKR